MAKSTSKLLVLFFISTFSASILMSGSFASSLENEAAASIERAEDALFSAYEVVLEAEQVGANVSSLLARLNEAGELLAEAQVAFRLKSFDEAVRLADLCFEICEETKDGADELRAEVYGSKVMSDWLTMTSSLASVIAVGFGSFCAWRVFKRRYYRRVFRMKPEVAKDEF